MIPAIIALIVGIAVGAGGIFAYNKKNENGGKNKAEDLVRKAKNEASDIVLKAKTDAASMAEKSQQEEAERRREWKKTENRLSEREANLDNKLDQLEQKPSALPSRKKSLMISKLKFATFAISSKKSWRKSPVSPRKMLVIN